MWNLRKKAAQNVLTPYALDILESLAAQGRGFKLHSYANHWYHEAGLNWLVPLLNQKIQKLPKSTKLLVFKDSEGAQAFY